MIVLRAMSENILRMAYNNDILKFNSNSVGITPLYCDIVCTASGTPGFNVRLYPAPDGTFFFNMKPFITSLINTRNFEDTLETDLDTADPASFIYNASSGTFLIASLNITVNMSNDTTEPAGVQYYYIVGAEQLTDYKLTLNKDNLYILSPFVKDTANHYYLKYWQGYPFDISLYFKPEHTLTIKNDTNLLEEEFTSAGHVKRLFLSDGRTDETLEDLLPLIDGFNKLTFMQGEAPDPDLDLYVTIEKVPMTCGVYIKWLNKYGGYSYWLFESTYSIDRQTKNMGELDRDIENLSDTFTRAIQIGKESQESIRCIADLLTEEQRDIVAGIFDSPKIYMFTGQPMSRASVNDWVEVSLKTTNARVKNAKQPLTNFSLDFELPQRYTITL